MERTRHLPRALHFSLRPHRAIGALGATHAQRFFCRHFFCGETHGLLKQTAFLFCMFVRRCFFKGNSETAIIYPPCGK
jgi:hypothetical protein